MNIHDLLSTSERERILGYLLEHPSEKISMNGLARKLGLSAGQIHKYVGILRGEGLVLGTALQETPLTRALRLLWNIKRIQEAKVVDVLRGRFPESEGIGIYGSWAHGTNFEGADLDIWLSMKKEPEDLKIAKARRELEERAGVPVDITTA